MRKTITAAVAAAALLIAGAGAATAAKPENPGEKGHCTAFFNGQKKGHEKQQDRNGSYPGPFQDLVDRQDDGDDSTGDIAELWDYCESEYGIGGNPAHGRFATCLTNDDDDPSTPDDDAEAAETHNCDD